MPTYDYECEACGHAFELFQSMTAAVKRKCPECRKSKLQRLIGKGAAVLFKGDGFYETDYRSSGYEKDKAADSGSTGKESADKPPTDRSPTDKGASPPDAKSEPSKAGPAKAKSGKKPSKPKKKSSD